MTRAIIAVMALLTGFGLAWFLKPPDGFIYAISPGDCPAGTRAGLAQPPWIDSRGMMTPAHLFPCIPVVR